MANLLWQKHLGMTIPWWFIGLGEAAGAFSFTGGILLWREPSRARGLTRHPVASDSAGPGEARRLLIRRWCSTERDRAPQSLFVSRGILPEHFTAVAFDLGLDGRRKPIFLGGCYPAYGPVVFTTAFEYASNRTESGASSVDATPDLVSSPVSAPPNNLSGATSIVMQPTPA